MNVPRINDSIISLSTGNPTTQLILTVQLKGVTRSHEGRTSGIVIAKIHDIQILFDGSILSLSEHTKMIQKLPWASRTTVPAKNQENNTEMKEWIGTLVYLHKFEAFLISIQSIAKDAFYPRLLLSRQEQYEWRTFTHFNAGPAQRRIIFEDIYQRAEKLRTFNSIMRREIYPRQVYSRRKQAGAQLSDPKLHPWPQYWGISPNTWSFTGRKRQRGDGVDDGDLDQ